MSPPLRDHDVLLLAAGLGRRLGAIGRATPKCLLRVGDDTLIRRSLRGLAAAGARRAVVVLGHRAADVAQDLSRRDLGLALEPVVNPAFAEGGSASSLAAGLSGIAEPRPLLILEADILYDPAFLALAGAAPAESAVLTADVSGSGDEVYAYVDSRGSLRALRKTPVEERADLRRSPGEFAGLTTLTPSAVAALRVLAFEGARGDYEDLLTGLPRSVSVRVRHGAGLPWCEVDTGRDLERAHREVLPRLLAREEEREPALSRTRPGVATFGAEG